jgi:hypothetical protein
MEEKIQLVYIGIRTNTTNKSMKRLHAYQQVRDGAVVDPFMFRLFSSQLLKCAVGSIIDCTAEINGDQMSIKGSREFAGFYPDLAQTTLWCIKSEAEKTQYDLWQIKRKRENSDPLLDHLQPVRESYRKLSRSSKRAFLAYLINYLEE